MAGLCPYYNFRGRDRCHQGNGSTCQIYHGTRDISTIGIEPCSTDMVGCRIILDVQMRGVCRNLGLLNDPEIEIKTSFKNCWCLFKV